MRIGGLQKTTLLDYPGKVAATVFLTGCNFRCPFCHNMSLAEADPELPEMKEEEVLAFLTKRQGILDGVCVTGGEPTLSPELPAFLKKIKALGLCVKLDTNGTRPDMLKELAAEELIDYVAMDIKTSLLRYPEVAGISAVDTAAVSESITFLKNGVLPFEFRTTVVKQYHNAEVFDEIGALLQGCQSYYLQSFQASDAVKDKSLCACEKNELLEFIRQLEKYDIKASLRGVD
ncbi:MAG: anaerobic ribonucleoside-triphosphate reductase activating protein [Lachnospiraceae bacterium]|nr:anaerobic ribonucleoside-triphosphate reductase activating protein [Lachnospiraceae bacterium]